ncbi:hypothetical protein [Alkalimarinus sediminis]|uniref:Uncharacterized protein n=1 Tax=Alkalimarinus sediminis TaxID=1632866 RepID=A0A9E8HLL1_9ALTE|nr:hypothetical protein [Alkalimarinus sediminis]UZW76367.1 hypothetical protein NNL22_07210 [Alkalimarinus sediminis]
MSNLATILVELLCHITVEPEGGNDPDDTADLQINSWQTLIHDLNNAEKEIVKVAAQSKLEALQNISLPTPEQEQLLGILAAYINDELQ